MKKVVTFGVFDYFHLGHLRLFEHARSYGDYLIVAVQDGDYIKKYKPEAEIRYSTQERVELIRSLRQVDEVVIYRDVDTDIRKLDFDVFAVGEDQNHPGFQRAMEYCVQTGRQVVHLKRTPHICSSEIKHTHTVPAEME